MIFDLGLRFFVNNEERLIKVTAGKRVDIYESCTCVFGRLLRLLWWTHVQSLASLIWLTAALLYPDSCLLFNLKECLRFLMTCGMRKVERDIKWHQILFTTFYLFQKIIADTLSSIERSLLLFDHLNMKQLNKTTFLL